MAALKSFESDQVLLALMDAKCDSFIKDQLLPDKKLNTGNRQVSSLRGTGQAGIKPVWDQAGRYQAPAGPGRFKQVRDRAGAICSTP